MTDQTPKKLSPLYGPASARIKALDKGLQKTLESTIKRWLSKRIELLESLPDDTRGELDEAGLLQTPQPAIPQVGARQVKARFSGAARMPARRFVVEEPATLIGE